MSISTADRDGDVMGGWNEIRDWRRAMRAKLISRRLGVPRVERARVRSAVGTLIREHFPELCHACVSFYWPFKGEIDLRHLVRDLLTCGAEAALPVVAEKQQPLEFWAWRPRMTLARGIWNIPIPGERNPVRPTALLVPLLGFDASGYRLGYGGGYYDRTLATLNPKPLTIGVGYALGRLATIHPQPHDIPLDAIVTETGLTSFRYRGLPRGATGPEQSITHDGDEKTKAAREGMARVNWNAEAHGSEETSYASPPCYLHEADADYLGAMSASETIALLNQLLEAERAGARAVGEMARQEARPPRRTVLRHIAMDEARCCAMLTRHITRLGGTPSQQTGAFYDRLLSEDSPTARIALLDRGQAWVVRKLDDVLPRIQDHALHRDLKEMLDVHVRNLESGRGLEC